LGGCSVINGALYNRCNKNDYDLWANFTGDPYWSFKNVLEGFKKIESYHGFYEQNPGED
jgi:choline dehydrogenase